jgi:hypothetical protein
MRGLLSSPDTRNQGRVQGSFTIRTSCHMGLTSILTSRTSLLTARATCRSFSKLFPPRRRTTLLCPDQRRKPRGQTLRPRKTQRFPGPAQFKMDQTGVRSTGVVLVHDSVAPRHGRCRQCSKLSGRGYTRGISRHISRARLHANPHPGISEVVEGTLRGSPA